MKSVFIVYNQAHTEKVEYLLDHLQLRGYTQWVDMKGRGSETGVPRMGTHTWPEVNSASMVVVEDHQVESLLEGVRKIDELNKEVGIRAFAWDIVAQY